MKAIAVTPGTTDVRLVDRPEPGPPAPDEVVMSVVRVGICGTDREEASGGRAQAPDGEKELVLGHEMLGKVVAVGGAVKRVRADDYAIFTVRRGCGRCMPCLMGRPDICRTGLYRERGIWGLHGYHSKYVVDKEAYVVPVPHELEPIAILTEPLSVVEKAIDESVRVQSARLPDVSANPAWPRGRPCLVAGLGPVGLLASLALIIRGAEVYGLDIVDAGSPRPQWLVSIGGRYIDGREIAPEKVADKIGAVDFIVEATGVAGLAFNLLDALAPSGIYVLTGIPGGDRPLQIPGPRLMRELVLDNQVMLGSVNAAIDHYQMAVQDLSFALLRWGDMFSRLITHRYLFTDFGTAFSTHASDEIKAVIEWS